MPRKYHYTKKTGAPAFYKTPADLNAKIDSYLKRVKRKRTITGLVLHLGFADRAAFYDYEQKPEFRHSIKAARTAIANSYEQRLHERFCTGSIFALKNFGWSDRQEIEHSGAVEFGPLVSLPAADGIRVDTNGHAPATRR